jgi:hypothetical protein
MRLHLWAACAAAACLLAVGFAAPAGEKKPAPDADKADLDAFKAYLAKQYPGKKWQQGPTRIDTPEIRKAYGKRRFYYVFSAPPLPPGAQIKSVIERYRQQVEEYAKHYISLTVAVDEGGKITPLQKPADFNTGLMKVAGEGDVKTAAAAVLSLYGSGRVGPGPVTADKVTVTSDGKGWSARATAMRLFQGTVNFDGDGKCTAVSKMYIGPLPS